MIWRFTRHATCNTRAGQVKTSLPALRFWGGDKTLFKSTFTTELTEKEQRFCRSLPASDPSLGEVRIPEASFENPKPVAGREAWIFAFRNSFSRPGTDRGRTTAPTATPKLLLAKCLLPELSACIIRALRGLSLFSMDSGAGFQADTMARHALLGRRPGNRIDKR